MVQGVSHFRCENAVTGSESLTRRSFIKIGTCFPQGPAPQEPDGFIRRARRKLFAAYSQATRAAHGTSSYRVAHWPTSLTPMGAVGAIRTIKTADPGGGHTRARETRRIFAFIAEPE